MQELIENQWRCAYYYACGSCDDAFLNDRVACQKRAALLSAKIRQLLEIE